MRRCNTVANIYEAIGDPRPGQLYGFLSDQQSQCNWILSLYSFFFHCLFPQANSVFVSVLFFLLPLERS